MVEVEAGWGIYENSSPRMEYTILGECLLCGVCLKNGVHFYEYSA